MSDFQVRRELRDAGPAPLRPPLPGLRPWSFPTTPPQPEVVVTGTGSRGAVLSGWDLTVLSALERWGMLGLGQIEGLFAGEAGGVGGRTNLFFNETGPKVYDRYPYKRLLKLERGRFIRRVSFVGLRKLYCLSPRGHAALGDRGLARHPGFRRSISPALVLHELMVNAVGLVMREVLDLPVRTELERISMGAPGLNIARQRRLIISDLWIADPARPAAVEVELRQKSRERYRPLWEEYECRMPPGGVVLYLAGWPGGSGRLSFFARRYGARRVYAADLAAFRAGPGSCRFEGSAPGEFLTLGMGK